MSTPAGWYLLRFMDELAPGLNPVDLGGRALMALRDGDAVRVFDATCPHRGADLAHGGTLERDCVVCPFHGKRIRLGGQGRLGVREHHVAQAGAAVFLRLGDEPRHDRGFEAALKEAGNRVDIVGAVVRPTRVPAPLVVENAFDIDHFSAVHKVPRSSGMAVRYGPDGELGIDGEFRTATSPWGGAAEREQARERGTRAGAVDYAVASTFAAVAYSPHVVLTTFGDGPDASVVLTGGVPRRDGTSQVRVAVGTPEENALPALLAGARKAIDEDVAVWDHLDLAAPARYDARDTAVLAFRQFCASFEEVGR